MLRLAAAHIGVENQPVFIKVLEQHNTLIRLAGFIHGRHTHRSRVGQFCLTRLFKPAFEHFQRVVAEITAAQPPLVYSRRRSATSVNSSDMPFILLSYLFNN